MNNKRIIFLLVLTAILVASCKERHNKSIDQAYQLTGIIPDSALSILDGIKQSKLSKSEKARYALVYTIAQDKGGLDIDNDSLLRFAYTYYKYRQSDSMYAKCEYYMGKYYLLNDSIEKAIGCLQESDTYAKKQNDRYTQCLALAQLSKALKDINPKKSLSMAKIAEDTYQNMPNAVLTNIVYYKLNTSLSLLLADSLDHALKKCNEAIVLSLRSGDSVLISDSYQDMSSILSEKRKFQLALYYSKKSFELCKSHDVSKLLNLAWAYLDVDSLSACERLLGNIKNEKPSTLYTAYYIRHIAAIKGKNHDKAIIYADSSYHYIEKMYTDELADKEKYYNSLVKSQYDKGLSEGRARLFEWIILFVILSAALAITFILYSYRQFKIRSHYRMQIELKEREAENKLHEEELRHKEIQLSTMRGYILKKVSMAQKLEKIKGNKEKNVVLTSEDWEEIQLFINSVEDGFDIRLKDHFPKLNDEDIKFLMLIRLRMPSKALGMIYNISEKSIRQKLFVYKSKVGLDNYKKMSLRTFIENF